MKEQTITINVYDKTGIIRGKAYFNNTSDVTIGRATDNDLVCEWDETVSKHHSKLSINGNEFIYSDHSTNGSYVDSVSCHNKSAIVKENQHIAIGSDAYIVIINKYHSDINYTIGNYNMGGTKIFSMK